LAQRRLREETPLSASLRLLRRVDLRTDVLNSGGGILQPNHCRGARLTVMIRREPGR
jgi:hypothetical protein